MGKPKREYRTRDMLGKYKRKHRPMVYASAKGWCYLGCANPGHAWAEPCPEQVQWAIERSEHVRGI